MMTTLMAEDAAMSSKEELPLPEWQQLQRSEWQQLQRSLRAWMQL